MMNLIKYKSVVGESGGGIFMIKNGLSALLKSPQKKLLPSQASKQLLMVESRLVVSDYVGVSAGFSSSAASATMGSRRFFNTCLRGGGGGGAPIHEHHHVSFNQVPGLMVPGTDENGETRCFLRFNPNSGSFEKDVDCKPLPVPHGYACKGSAYGWVFLVGDELDTKLMNIFTGDEIQLPSVSTLPQPTPGWMGINKLYVLKAVFSSDPSLQPAPLVMVIHRGDTTRLAYCKPGDTSWTSLHHPDIQHMYDDVVFYNDQFYGISQPGYIMGYDIGRRTNDNNHSVRKTLIAPGPALTKPQGDLYLVVLDGELIKITRKISCDEAPYISFKVGGSMENGPILSGPILGCDFRHVTDRFMIRRFVASMNKWIKVESLGDNALFLGQNTSFSLRASQHPGCIPNAIYFTDCSIRQNQESGSDMGVYKLSDQSVTPLYSVYYGLTLPPPVMVTRVPCADSSYAARGGDFSMSQ